MKTLKILDDAFRSRSSMIRKEANRARKKRFWRVVNDPMTPVYVGFVVLIIFITAVKYYCPWMR